LPALELFIFFQEQPLLIQDLLEQEKREQQQQQQQLASSLLMGQSQQHTLIQQQLLEPTPTLPGTDPLGRPPMMPMWQYPAVPHAGGMHPMMGLCLPAAPIAAAPPGVGWPPRHPQEVTLQQRSPHQMMVPHQVPVTNFLLNFSHSILAGPFKSMTTN
jgi:histone-lysine N-methyltransferase MLL3